MTSFDQVRALVAAHVSRDQERFRAITLQIAASLASRSESHAKQLRDLVEKQQAVPLLPIPGIKGLLSAPPDQASLDDMVLAPNARGMLDRILLEYEQRGILQIHSLCPARKLLFSGPPGTGKTMAAGAIARAIQLPLFRVELHGLIASHLGETSANLAKVFEHVRELPAVYLFDEFDALGMSRTSVNDGSSAGAEMRRVVNTLLQLIEDDRSSSLLIAATNHPQVLDPAIFRRFDEIVTFPPLSKIELSVLTDRALSGFDTGSLDYEAICTAIPTLGHSDLCSALDRLCKDHVITRASINTERVIGELRRRLQHTVTPGLSL